MILDRKFFIFRTKDIEYIDSDVPYGYSVYFKKIIEYLSSQGY